MKERTRLQTVMKFFSLVRLRKMEYLRLVFTSILMGVNGVIYVFFLERAVFFLENMDHGKFHSLLLFFFAYVIVHEIAHFATRRWGWVETENLGQGDIHDMYMRKFIGLNNNEVEKVGVGKLVGIITQGASTWVFCLTDAFIIGISTLISIGYSIYMVSQVGFRYGFGFIVILSITLIYILFINTKTLPLRRARYEIRNSRLKNIVKVLMSKNEILQANKIDNEVEKLHKTAYQLKIIDQDMGIFRKLLRYTPLFIISLVICTFFYVGGNKVLDGTMNMSLFVGISGILILMQRSVHQAIKFLHDLTKKFTDIEKMWDFFENTPDLEGYNTGKNFDYKKGNIELESLSFSYDKGEKVFDDFNLKLDGGKIYALVGNSGSGKSTLAKLISGYLRHDSGRLIIDGQDIKDISLKSYYQNIGYLTQEPSVFDGSVIDNLTYAVTRTVSDERLAKVVELAKCEFIYDFKDGLETEIGEKGIRLSGGQRQRLAIAKIMLKDPKIIILDEPTSALDSFSEEQITEAMNNLFTGKTVIVIAHRLQTVKHADTIFVMQNGEIVEQGNHKDLVEKNGIYNKMLELQSGF